MKEYAILLFIINTKFIMITQIRCQDTTLIKYVNFPN